MVKINMFVKFRKFFHKFSNEVVSYDKLLLRSIMIEVATFLLDLDRITEPALQRIASIALRQINNGHQYSISHDQLVRRIRNLTTDDQDLFLEELKRLLVNMLSVMTATPQRSIAGPTVSDGEEIFMCMDNMPPPSNLQSAARIQQRPQTIENDDSIVAEGGEAESTETKTQNKREDLAEADQKCCMAEDSARPESDSHGVRVECLQLLMYINCVYF